MGRLSAERLGLLRRLVAGLPAAGRSTVTSRDLGRWLGVSAETVRKDLSGLGSPSPGAAYDAVDLAERLARRFSEPEEPGVTVLVGLGPLGLALGGWTFAAGFDGGINRLETVDVPYPVYPTTEIIPVCRRLGAQTAVLAVPAGDAQRLAERLVQAGLRRLVNYGPAALRVDRHRVEVSERGGL